jgi:hypothetical protein
MLSKLKVVLSLLVLCAATNIGPSHAGDSFFVWKKDGLPATALAAIPDGSLVGTSGALVWRLRSNGELLWEKKLGAEGSYDVRINDVIVLPDDDLIVTGVRYEYFKGRTQNGDLWVAQIGAKGELLWEKTFGGGKEDFANSIARFPKGGFAVVGETVSKGEGSGDVWVLRLDSTGMLIWEKTFGGKSRDSAQALATLADGGLAVAGWTSSKGEGETDIWVLRLDENGKLLWDKTIGGDKLDGGYAIVVLPDGSLVVGGETWSQGARWVDVKLARFDANGELLWNKRIGTEERDRIKNMVVLPDGELIVAASAWNRGASFGYGWVVGIDASGNVLWDKILSGDERITVDAIVAFPDGKLIISGGTFSLKEQKWNSWLALLAK